MSHNLKKKKLSKTNEDVTNEVFFLHFLVQKLNLPRFR